MIILKTQNFKILKVCDQGGSSEPSWTNLATLDVFGQALGGRSTTFRTQ